MRIPFSCLNPSRSSTSIPVTTCASIGSEFAARELVVLKRARLANNSADVAPQTARSAGFTDRVRLRHHRHGKRTQDAAAVVNAAIQNHLAVDRQIIHG